MKYSIFFLILLIQFCGGETAQECRKKCSDQFLLCSYGAFTSTQSNQLPNVLFCQTLNNNCYLGCSTTTNSRSSSSSSTNTR